MPRPLGRELNSLRPMEFDSPLLFHGLPGVKIDYLRARFELIAGQPSSFSFITLPTCKRVELISSPITKNMQPYFLTIHPFWCQDVEVSPDLLIYLGGNHVQSLSSEDLTCHRTCPGTCLKLTTFLPLHAGSTVCYKR